MKRLGKLLLLAVLSVIVLNGSTVEKVFGLKDQEFTEVSKDKLNRYKVNDNLIVSMQLVNNNGNGYYYSGNKPAGGLFQIKLLKHGLKNWIINENMTFSCTSKTDSYLRFIDNNGLSIDIKFKNYNILIDGKKINDNGSNNKKTILKVLFVNNKLSIYENDKKIYTESKRFSNLIRIEQIFNEHGQDYRDILYDFILSEIK